MSVRTYDPNDISMSFFGYPITGFMEGSFITVERDTETFTKVTGVGDVSRTRSHNKGGRITFTLMQTAPANDYLGALLAADEISKNVIGPCIIKDNSGNSTYVATESWLVTQPTGEFATDQTARSYTIDVSDLSMFTGASADPAINGLVNTAIAAYSVLTN